METENGHFDRTEFCSGLFICCSHWSFFSKFVLCLRRHNSTEVWWSWLWYWGAPEEKYSMLCPVRVAWRVLWEPSYEILLLPCPSLAGSHAGLKNNVLILQLIFNFISLLLSLSCWAHSLWINCYWDFTCSEHQEISKNVLTFLGIECY